MPEVEEKDVTLEWYKSNVLWTRDLGLLAIKTLVTLNSGAFVVLLTFIGNAAAQSAFVVALDPIKFSMFCFLAGIVSIFLVIALAFINTNLFSPYDLTKGFPDHVAMPIYVLLASCSLAAFVWGVVSVVSNVSLK